MLLRVAFLSVLAWFGGLAAAMAAVDRVALLIGNSDYQTVGSLSNPVNDATDLAEALERVGFTVTLLTDADFVEMHRALQTFAEVAAEADMALVYFAGHGLEIDKQNYLIPVDAQLATDRRVMLETISLDLVSEAVSGARSLRMVLIDACRNNPFLGQMQVSDSGRSLGRGLSPFEPTGGTLVAFAAKGGTIALDGSGRNSPFMRGLLAHIEEPGLDVNLMFRKVRDEVLAETNNRQEPFTYGSLPGREIYLVPPVEVAVAAPPVEPQVVAAPRGTEEEEFAWSLLASSGDAAQLQMFIRTYPQGVHVGEAFARLSDLMSPPAATAPAPEPIAEIAAIPVPVPVIPAVVPEVPVETLVAALPEQRDVITPVETPAPVEPDPGLLIMAVQEELKRAGCNPGPVDGDWGPRSKRALTAFGRDGDIDIGDGVPSEALLTLLRSKPGTVCVQVAVTPPRQTTAPAQPRATPKATPKQQVAAEEPEPEPEEEEDDGGSCAVGMMIMGPFGMAACSR